MSDNDQGRTVEDIAAEKARHNPDETTRREAIELELEDEGRSEAGEQLGEHIE